MTEKKQAFLDNWILVQNEDGTCQLCGVARGHIRIRNDEFVTTSTLINFNSNTAETQNTVYTLGLPSAKAVTGSWALANSIYHAELKRGR